MLKGLVVAGLICVTVSGQVSAYDDKGGYTIFGVGNRSCGEWTQARRAHDSSEHAAWVLGFVTAINAIIPMVHNVAAGTDAQGLLAWTDNYCAAHPLDTLSTASILLVQDLSKRRIGP